MRRSQIGASSTIVEKSKFVRNAAAFDAKILIWQPQQSGDFALRGAWDFMLVIIMDLLTRVRSSGRLKPNRYLQQDKPCSVRYTGLLISIW